MHDASSVVSVPFAVIAAIESLYTRYAPNKHLVVLSLPAGLWWIKAGAHAGPEFHLLGLTAT
ncbi:MAG: hypothetical protein ACLFSC_01635 [Wenzhouxiangella sp.]